MYWKANFRHFARHTHLYWLNRQIETRVWINTLKCLISYEANIVCTLMFLIRLIIKFYNDRKLNRSKELKSLQYSMPVTQCKQTITSTPRSLRYSLFFYEPVDSSKKELLDSSKNWEKQMFLPNYSSYMFSSYIPASNGNMSHTLLESSVLCKPPL